jgi:enoyl-CoA hydratase/carnithine racemase
VRSTIMEFNTIQVMEKVEGVGIIILNRPERRNAISIEMRLEISKCLNAWKTSKEIGAVIFTGSGSAFSAGFDLNEFDQPELFKGIFESSSKYHREVWNFPKPTIASVNGPAMAGGFDLTTLCDIRICSESASFGHPEIKFGVPPLFTPLRWIIGDGLARDLCLTGRRIDGQEAYRIGLVSEIVRKDGLLEQSVRIGTMIREAPLEALQYTKRYLVGNAGYGFEECFQVEHDRAFQEFLQTRKYEKLGLK